MVQLLVETFYFRIPKQIKGLNKELPYLLGQSSRTLFYANNGVKVYYYPATRAQRPGVSAEDNIFLVYATINRPYILDLYPGNSLIEYLCREGFNVYLLEWIPEPAGAESCSESITSELCTSEAYTSESCASESYTSESCTIESFTIEEQIFTYMLDAVNETLKAAKIDKINLAGYCQGGTYALIALYYYPELFRRVVLYNTPVDFTDAGLFQMVKFLPPSLFSNNPFDALPFQLTDVPAYPGDLLLLNRFHDTGEENNNRDDKGKGNHTPVPVSGSIQHSPETFLRLPADGCLPDAMLLNSLKWLRAVNKWENDAVPIPKKVFSEWVRYFYQDNLLAKNELSFFGKKIKIEDITTPVLSIVADVDDIAPKTMATPIKTRLPAGKELCIPGGHLSTTAGSFAVNHSWPATVSWFRT